MSKFQTKEFKQLQEKWYKKLKSSGYEDIEQDENNLKEWDSYAFKSRYNKHLFSSKEAYYQLAGQFLHTYEFMCARDKLIWELHSEGHSITQISEKLRKKHYKRYYRTGIHVIIQGLTKEMLRQYRNEEDE